MHKWPRVDGDGSSNLKPTTPCKVMVKNFKEGGIAKKARLETDAAEAAATTESTPTTAGQTQDTDSKGSKGKGNKGKGGKGGKGPRPPAGDRGFMAKAVRSTDSIDNHTDPAITPNAGERATKFTKQRPKCGDTSPPSSDTRKRCW